VKNKLEGKERELRELIKEISKYDDNFHSGKKQILQTLNFLK
jgi:hypothetical protein